jgi:hypothetical protein
MKIGFTGTRLGLLPVQRVRLREWFHANLTPLSVEDEDAEPADELHHGCCVGADDEATEIAVEDEFTRAFPKLIAHPCDLPDFFSQTAYDRSHVRLPEKPPLARNFDIAFVCEVLLAAPQGTGEQRRSGTWSTVRRARALGRRVIVFWPDGRVTEESASRKRLESL